jgi:hypothetical protein
MMDIDTLSRDEQRRLFDQLSHRLNQVTECSPEESMVWDDLNDVLKRSARERQPLRSFLRGASGNGGYGQKKYRERLDEIDGLVTRAVPEMTRRPVKVAVRRMALRCLARHLVSREIPATPKTMLDNLAFLPHAVEQAYPGYIASRLLHRVAVRSS